MYNSELFPRNTPFNSVDRLLQQTTYLSLEEKAELVERLLAQESDLMVISATSDLADYIIAQTHLLSFKGLTYVWKAIADQILEVQNCTQG